MIYDLIEKFTVDVGEKLGLEFCILDVFGLFVKHFLECQRDALPEEYLSIFLDIFRRKVHGKCDGSIIYKTMEAKNLAGRLLQYKNDETMAGNFTRTLNQLAKYVDS